MDLRPANPARGRPVRFRLIRGPKEHRRRRLRAILEHVLVLGVALAGFYLVPVTGRFWDFSAIVFWFVVVALIGLVGQQLVKQAKAGSDPSVRLRTLLFLLYPIISVFALAYYVLQVHDPTELSGLVTRTDSLYYTVVTLGTVGFGDIHPAGQIAKVITMAQIVFDLVVIGLLLAVAGARMMSWAQVTVQQSADGGLEIGVSQMPDGESDDDAEANDAGANDAARPTGEIS